MKREGKRERGVKPICLLASPAVCRLEMAAWVRRLLVWHFLGGLCLVSVSACAGAGRDRADLLAQSCKDLRHQCGNSKRGKRAAGR